MFLTSNGSATHLIFAYVGLAIRKDELDRWNASSACRPAPDDHMYCPLCQAPVADSDHDWRTHLVSGCAKNKRNA